MHWLPLVAMVIASALPFPQSPQVRIVAAETVQNFDNGSSDINSSLVRTDRVTLDYKSENVSKKDYKLVASEETYKPPPTSAGQASYPAKSTPGDYSSGSRTRQALHMYKAKHRQAGMKSKSSLLGSTADVRDSEEQGSSAEDRLRDPQDYKMHSHQSLDSYNDHDNHILLDYKSKPSGLSQRDGTDVPTLQLEETDIRTEKAESGLEKGELDNSVFPLSSPISSPESSTDGAWQRAQPQGDTVDRTLQGGLGLQKELGVDLGLGIGLGNGGLQGGDELLFLDSHPRVLFSSSPSPPKHPPLLLMLEKGLLSEEDDGSGEEKPAGAEGRSSYKSVLLGVTDAPSTGHRSQRKRRSIPQHGTQGRERAVCEERSDWVTDKTKAVDIHLRVVDIMPEVMTQTGPLKQYFYETSCTSEDHSEARADKPGGGCLGVDKRQWLSKCKTKHSYVRALTSYKGRNGWRWIRINSSCSCVLLARAKRQ
ncbi:uncharacterized protein ntf4 [Denticeps clupeoides]|uniref:Neurotrophin-4 n=1 Tax=Denticeps clupeoides TaxID=299321 RepID=A0AAY4DA10_9TELE|nr:uncharacterized protein LOC114793898 [Denticeps clupeoides]